ncbi:exodeoxyribonuclease V subunit alpha [Chlamydia sp. 17-3921]|uniref:exodeoxyribonuclease V subunit alpha n=1 Tax=Chlamydia sp. 17-3921 TaxID=2675798 RepID=UPI00191A7A3D|nr:exodeoxyribonuclease V subunit alpha [Chlamydia sp. 17-3921]
MSKILENIPTLLKNLLKQQIVVPLDILFARRYAPKNFEKAFIFLAISSALWRYGHPFLYLHERRITPSLSGVSEEDLYQGLKELPEGILSKLFVIDNQKIYLRSLYNMRVKLFQKLKLLSLATTLFPFPEKFPNSLSEIQCRTLKEVSKSCFSIVCGGPGTGKTFLAIQFILSLVKKNPKIRIAVVSPTGKVSSHFLQLLSHYDLPEGTILVKTIHRFLQEYAYYQFSVVDVLIVDEGSMVTFNLLYSLVQTLQGYSQEGVLQATSMIILGDVNQLPPIGIGAGNPLQELIDVFPNRTFYLKVSYRAKTEEIQNFSQAILKRQLIPFTPLLKIDSAVKSFAKTFEQALSEPQTSLCILSPMRVGLWGYINLNFLIHNELQRCNPDLPIPIMISDRYETWGLFNGDTGMLYPKSQKLAFDRGISIDANIFSHYTYNYAMSIHKSQGSEYDEVIVILPKGSEVFESSLLYTAVTRAKHKISVWADAETLHKIIKKPRKHMLTRH